MKRLVLPVLPDSAGIIRLRGEDYHYMVRVRRLRNGSYFNAVLPGGRETRVRILSTADNTLIGECAVGGKKDSLIPPIALFQGLPKGNKIDLIIRQAAEGGVSLVAPFESEYSVAKIATAKIAVRHNKGRDLPDGKATEAGSAKLGRWERIIREARQQSGSPVETVVKAPCGFNSLMDRWESLKKEYLRPVGIFLHQEALETEPLAKGSFHHYLCNCPDFVALAVGPEGGFSPGEVSRFLAAGFKPLLIGDTILRTETAALYSTAAVRVILLESESWMSKE